MSWDIKSSNWLSSLRTDYHKAHRTTITYKKAVLKCPLQCNSEVRIAICLWVLYKSKRKHLGIQFVTTYSSAFSNTPYIILIMLDARYPAVALKGANNLILFKVMHKNSSFFCSKSNECLLVSFWWTHYISKISFPREFHVPIAVESSIIWGAVLRLRELHIFVYLFCTVIHIKFCFSLFIRQKCI